MTTRSWATTPAVRRVMRANANTHSRPERRLVAALRRLGLQGTTHAPVVGTPDVAWMTRRLAVFVDGTFWHGHGRLPVAHRGYWRAVFAAARFRDRQVDRTLRRQAWTVLRFTDDEVNRHPHDCAQLVRNYLGGA